MDEVIDDLISLESGFNDGGLDCMEPNIIMQNNVSMNYIKLSPTPIKNANTLLQSGFQGPPPKAFRPSLAWKKCVLVGGGTSVHLRSA